MQVVTDEHNYKESLENQYKSEIQTLKYTVSE